MPDEAIMAKSGNTGDIGDFLVTQNILTVARLAEYRKIAQAEQRGIEEVLMERAALTPEALLKAKSAFYGLPAVDLTQQAVTEMVLRLVPLELAQYYQLVPFRRDNNDVWIALVHPENYKSMEAVDVLGRQHGWKPKYAITTSTSLLKVLRQYSSLTSEVGEALKMAEDDDQSALRQDENVQEFEEVLKAAPVAKMVASILRHAVEGGASDIHIEPGDADSRVRFRVDGILRTSLTLPKYIHSAVISRIKVLANLKIDETRQPQDGRIRLRVVDKVIDFRISTMPVIGNEKVVMRILDPTTGVRTFEGLGFTGQKLRILKEAIQKPHGMFLVTGPTGSGKTTTLYAVLNILNREEVNIITLEDPVEYFMGGVNQSQVNPEVGYTFANGLRSILRQDPDIIMVGEIRDSETAELAIHASLTGHILLSTLHTNDAPAAILRLTDMHIEPFLIASTVNVIIGQRLVRKLCESCRKPGTLPPEMLKKIQDSFAGMGAGAKEEVPAEPWTTYEAGSCSHCENSGYRGRVAITEILANTAELQKIIADGAKPHELKAEFVRQGSTSLMQDGYLKVLSGMTSLEEVLTAAQD
ncbi:MAG: GspE/PulE family protein [Patescibacteria group bacterium]